MHFISGILIFKPILLKINVHASEDFFKDQLFFSFYFDKDLKSELGLHTRNTKHNNFKMIKFAIKYPIVKTCVKS